jgi:hypothetical protein
MARMTFLLACWLATGCYAEGNSYFLTDGETERFLTIGRCEREAAAHLPDGQPKYSGYKCRGKFVGFTTSKRDYYNGKLQSASQ